MPYEAFDDLYKLEARLGLRWRHIHDAHDKTVTVLEQLGRETAGVTIDDASIVAFGSLGRFEANSESDVDWTYLVDGQANLSHQEAAHRAGKLIGAIGKEPGSEGTFGSLAFSHEIVQHIGGQDDSNANLTRRVLLLLESVPVGRREAYDRVLKVVLKRYLTGDYGWLRGRNPHGVPRYLLNDIVRYWRTVAVDFAYKQWTRDNKGWALRSAKLRLSRKLIYAAGLLYCFSMSTESWASDDNVSQTVRKMQGIEHMFSLAGSTPLDILARAFEKSRSLDSAAGQVFGVYDEFLGVLADSDKRKHLDALLSDQADSDPVWKHVRELGVSFQNGLDQLFIHDKSTGIPELVLRYGIF